MSTTLGQADHLAEELVPVLEEFSWFHGVAVEQDQGGYFVCVRVSTGVPLEDARANASIPLEKGGIRIAFRHREMATAFKVAG
jgi:hypothetical protein